MQAFRCPVCGQLVFFENFSCLQCGSALGFAVEDRTLLAVAPTQKGASATAEFTSVDGAPGRYRYCANELVARCNWLLASDAAETLCRSCRLTSMRPNDAEIDAMAAFADAEAAKRRLVDQVLALELPLIDRQVDAERGVTFELLSSRGSPVTTGHESGVITLDLSESDDAHRAFVQQQLGEPYRTVLGHLRHEAGHYFWPLIVVEPGRLDEFRALFGDERASYADAREQHYGANDSSDEWTATHVSKYATMHPWEDWAETFAHYLHILDGLETADSFGLHVGDPSRAAAGHVEPATAAGAAPRVGGEVREWLVLTLALNAMSRSIGERDLYPFVLSPTVVGKLDFVHRCVVGDVAAPT